MRSWQVREAKARFSDLLRDAARSGPLQITVRGRATAVVLSTEAYERLCGPTPSLAAFLRDSPLAGTEIDIEREPVAVTNHGRTTGQFIAAEDYEAFKRYKEFSRAFATVELSDEKADAIAASRMDPRHAHLDALLDE